MMFIVRMVAVVLTVFIVHLSTQTAHAINQPDPANDSPHAPADITQLDIQQDHSQLRITLTTAQPYAFANTQFLIETDRDPKTGHALNQYGYDILIEGANLFAFETNSESNHESLDQTAWTWKPIGQVARHVDQNNLVIDIDTALLNSERVYLIARTVSDDYATVYDTVPDDRPVRIAITPPPAPGTEATGDTTTPDPARDITSSKLSQHQSDLQIDITTAAPSDFANLLLFFDTDNNPNTGFQPPADPRFGFDMLINGGTLSKHTGNQRGDWTWSAVGQTEQAIDHNKLALRLNAAMLETATVRMAAWMMSADWQERIDIAPDAGMTTLPLDMTHVKTITKKPVTQLAPPKPNRDLPARQRVAQADSFYCYYGSGKTAELSHYDVVILHSPQMHPDDIATLNAQGVVTIGYITVGEDDELRTGDTTGPAGYASWYFDRDNDGQPDRNTIWNSWFANAADPAWRHDRVAEAKRLVEEDGYHGIFLDTIDTATNYAQSTDGMVQLVAELREALPDAPIILNQGFPIFHRLAPYADGLMLESFTATFDFQSKQYMLNYPASLDAHMRTVNKKLKPVLADYPMPIFVLDYTRPTDIDAIQIAADRAATFGFLFAAAPIYLDDVYINDIVGQPNDKWLDVQATPESMAITLNQTRNGFPIGTTITPSSCFAGYTIKPLIDGITDRSALHWTDAAWASADDESDAWLEIKFPTPPHNNKPLPRAGNLHITWAIDSGVTHIAQNYHVSVHDPQTDQWISPPLSPAHSPTHAPTHAPANSPALPTTHANQTISTHALPDIPFDAIRIDQPYGGGSTARPEILWIAQIQYTPAPPHSPAQP